MKLKSHIANAILLATILLSGCATTPGTTSTQATPTQVPSLKVAIDCGTCQVRQNVPGLIIEGYNEAASKAGATVSTSDEATATIKGYSDRSDTARFLAGAFAGKDEIQAIVITQDKKFTVEDYYRNAWLGIESLAKKIGEMIFSEVNK